MYKKCQICVNCGRCAYGEEKAEKTKVVRNTPFAREFEQDLSESGKRLVTVDIGTTTVAMELCDHNGHCVDHYVCVNPQVQYGADVISRITAAADRSAAMNMKALIRSTLQKGLERFKALLGVGESFVMVVAANTTMVYLLMGWDPAELGHAPFAATHLEPFCFLFSPDEIPCYVFGGAYAFVGGDLVAGMHAVNLQNTEKITLLIDLGTNGEMLLGNKERIMGCATAAGPAFEGGANRGIWGADMVSFTAKLLREGILDEYGTLADPYLKRGIRIGDVCITEETVRALQCAKAAIMAGIRILTKRYGISGEEIDRVILSGGFGYFLDPKDAVEIGLIPEAFLEKTCTGGNTALEGAKRAGEKLLLAGLPSEGLDAYLGTSNVQIFNLAEEEMFENFYIEAMNLIKV